MTEINFTSQEIVKKFDLLFHPEGAHFKEIYKSEENVPIYREEYGKNVTRPASTAIYFFLTRETKSKIHRHLTDEVWHHYQGASVKLTMFLPNGTLQEVILGKNFASGEVPVFVVPGRMWVGANLAENGEGWALLGNTVAPGFVYEDWTMPEKDELLRMFPQHADIISELA